MNVAKLGCLVGASALCFTLAGSGEAQVDFTSCFAQASFLDLNECRDANTGEVVGFSRGVAVDGDQFLSFQAGKNGGLAPFEIINASVDIRDANGALLEDCRPVSTAPGGVFIFGFGSGGAACDTGVSQSILVFYDDEVRL